MANVKAKINFQEQLTYVKGQEVIHFHCDRRRPLQYMNIYGTYASWNTFLSIPTRKTKPSFEDSFTAPEEGNINLKVKVVNNQHHEAEITGWFTKEGAEDLLSQLVTLIPGIIWIEHDKATIEETKEVHEVTIKQGSLNRYNNTKAVIEVVNNFNGYFSGMLKTVEELNQAIKLYNNERARLLREKLKAKEEKHQRKLEEARRIRAKNKEKRLRREGKEVIKVIEQPKAKVNSSFKIPEGEDMRKLNTFLKLLEDKSANAKFKIAATDKEGNEVWNFEGAFNKSKQMLIKNVLAKRFEGAFVNYTNEENKNFIYSVKQK